MDEVVQQYIEDIIKNAVEKYEYNKDMLIEYLKEVS
jgi:hypothetical protein